MKNFINRVYFVNTSKISELAKEKGLTLTGLETEIGLSHGMINRWKKNGASANALGIVADHLGTTVDELLEKR